MLVQNGVNSTAAIACAEQAFATPY